MSRPNTKKKTKHVCTHKDAEGRQDPLCKKYGCPDDPNWKGDGCK